MINPIFKKYEFLYDYFEQWFKTKKRFPQSLVFEGLDTLSQYFFATELARILNCEKNGDYDCDCTNCKWIREGKHPSVINVSPLDFKEDGAKTVISVKQIEKITSAINESSDYHRFFIFLNAKDAVLSKPKEDALLEYKNSGYSVSTENWYPYPLTRKVLQEEASNALLKSTEEAPDKVTFVFLTNTKEDLISTIVSRSLVFKLSTFRKKENIDLSCFFENYPNMNIEVSLQRANDFIEKQNGDNLDMVELLDCAQEYFLSLLKQNLNLKNLIEEDIRKIQTAKKRVQALVSPKYAIESLFISLSKEGRNL